MYSYQDVDLDDYDDTADVAGRVIKNTTNTGLILEQYLYHKARDAGLVPSGFSPTSSGSGVDMKLFLRDYTYAPIQRHTNFPELAKSAIDLIITPHRGQVVGIELKESASDDYGQSQMEWDESRGWYFYGRQDNATSEKRTQLVKANAHAKINQVWKNKPAPKLFKYLKEGKKSSQVPINDRLFDKETFQSESIQSDAFISITENYYTSKSCPYINVASHGLYYFSSDPLGLGMKYGVKSFRSAVSGMSLRFRYKPSGVSSYGFNAALKVDGLQKSPVNLMDDEWIMQFQEDAITCGNAPYVLQQVRERFKP